MILAGYVDLAPAHKLALIKLCDSADERTRLGFPGLDAVRVWSGLSRSRALQVIKDLQEQGLVMQVQAGHRGQRAVYKVFPAPGDEMSSLAHTQGRPCPGAALFAGVPSMPTDVDITDRITSLDAPKGSRPRDPSRKGPVGGTQTVGSCQRDPEVPGKGPAGTGKGPTRPIEGSGRRDPFGQDLHKTTTTTTGTALADTPSPAEPAPIEPRAVVEQHPGTGVGAAVLAEHAATLRIGPRSMDRLAPLVDAALRAGWSQEELITHLAGNLAGARAPAAVLHTRLRDLPPPPPPGGGSVVKRPRWCGACDPDTRLVGDDHPRRCPTCHPQPHRDRQPA